MEVKHLLSASQQKCSREEATTRGYERREVQF